MKRFYKIVELVEAHPDTYEIHLDGKPIKTPSQHVLSLDNKPLAEAICNEWRCIEEKIDQDKLPLTQLYNTYREYIPQNRVAIESTLKKYLETDLLVYHTPEPEDLAKLQQEKWGAILDIFAQETQITLTPRTDFLPTPLSDKALDTIQTYLSGLGDAAFTVFQCAVAATGSFILGFMFVQNKLCGEEIQILCELEERFYEDQYDLLKHGPDPMREKKSNDLKQEFQALTEFMMLTTQTRR